MHWGSKKADMFRQKPCRWVKGTKFIRFMKMHDKYTRCQPIEIQDNFIRYYYKKNDSLEFFT